MPRRTRFTSQWPRAGISLVTVLRTGPGLVGTCLLRRCMRHCFRSSLSNSQTNPMQSIFSIHRCF